MTTLRLVMPNQRRVRAEMDAWANGQKLHAVKLVSLTPENSVQLSRRMAKAMTKPADGNFELA